MIKHDLKKRKAADDAQAKSDRAHERWVNRMQELADKSNTKPGNGSGYDDSWNKDSRRGGPDWWPH